MNLVDKPAAQAWARKYPDATRNLNRVLELLIKRYRGGIESRGYINRAKSIEYRFGVTQDEDVIRGVSIVGRQGHVKVRFQLIKPRRRNPFKSRSLADRDGNRTTHVVDINVGADDSLKVLGGFLRATRTFSGSHARGNGVLKEKPLSDHIIDAETAYDPRSPQEGKELTWRAARIRLGQPDFRRKLLRHYHRRCLISDCSLHDVLEAAHITPYNGRATNKIGNGLLLRADLHSLWDKNLLAIDPMTFKVWVAEAARVVPYKNLHGKPVDRSLLVGAIQALRVHWEDAVR